MRKEEIGHVIISDHAFRIIGMKDVEYMLERIGPRLIFAIDVRDADAGE